MFDAIRIRCRLTSPSEIRVHRVFIEPEEPALCTLIVKISAVSLSIRRLISEDGFLLHQYGKQYPLLFGPPSILVGPRPRSLVSPLLCTII